MQEDKMRLDLISRQAFILIKAIDNYKGGKVRDVLVIGAGIAGSAAALALAKRGIYVTILSSSPSQRSHRDASIEREEIIAQLKDWQQALGYSRANEQMGQLAKKSFKELIECQIKENKGPVNIWECLQTQLKEFPHVEWLPDYRAVELLNLESHSLKFGDLYKKPTCLGAYAYCKHTEKVETILAKETILATGGAAALFPHTTSISGKGEGFAMAHQAGARLVNMEHIQFYPFTLVSKDRICLPIPLKLFQQGATLFIDREPYPVKAINGAETVKFYQKLNENKIKHGKLDLSSIDPSLLKEKFPKIEAYYLSQGLNPAKDKLSVIPAAYFTPGGVVVDRVGQTTLHRLRALGEVACTGLHGEGLDRTHSILESLTWATACAEDISKQIKKFVYYFPEIKGWEDKSDLSGMIREEGQLVRQLMGIYGGLQREYPTLRRGYQLLQSLHTHFFETSKVKEFSYEQRQFKLSLQASLLILQAALEKQNEFY